MSWQYETNKRILERSAKIPSGLLICTDVPGQLLTTKESSFALMHLMKDHAYTALQGAFPSLPECPGSIYSSLSANEGEKS